MFNFLIPDVNRDHSGWPVDVDECYAESLGQECYSILRRLKSATVKELHEEIHKGLTPWGLANWFKAASYYERLACIDSVVRKMEDAELSYILSTAGHSLKDLQHSDVISCPECGAIHPKTSCSGWGGKRYAFTEVVEESVTFVLYSCPDCKARFGLPEQR